jgi:membrane protein YqaA with SNARE-associated domain
MSVPKLQADSIASLPGAETAGITVHPIARGDAAFAYCLRTLHMPLPRSRRESKHLLRSLYDRVLALAADRRAPAYLGGVSFAESSFFPVPPDAMLIPMCLARPDHAWRYALICTVSSVLGGILGYAIGFYLFDSLAAPVLRAYGYADALAKFQGWYERWGAAVILIKGLTPIPYKIVTIASGAAHFDFWTFLAASIVTRGGRFFLLAALLRRFGAPVRDVIERRLTLVTSAAAAAIVLGFLVLKFI